MFLLRAFEDSGRPPSHSASDGLVIPSALEDSIEGKPDSHLVFPTIIISDLHLGKTKVVEAERLLEFLENVSCETLILNGDIIDGWYLKRHKHIGFPESHARVLDAINKKAFNGTRVVYIPGNHDWRLRYKTREETRVKSLSREYPEFNQTVCFGSIDGRSVEFEFKSGMIYTDPKGKKVSITHGDERDSSTANALAHIGDVLYEAALYVNAASDFLQRYFNANGKHFSLAKFLKGATKECTGVIQSFEAAAEDLPPGVDMWAAGHIHVPILGENYLNSGDWIDSCTGLAHDADGTWRVLEWNVMRAEKGYNGHSPYSINEPNPNADMRSITNRQLRLISHLWPGWNKSKILKQISNRRQAFEVAEGAHEEGHPVRVKADTRLTVARDKLFPKPI